LAVILKRYQDAQGPAINPYAAQHEANRQSREEMAKAEMAGAQERKQGIQALMSKKEERVAKQEERLKEQDDMSLNMSLINAGLSMMQSTGKGLAGIAEGAQKGVSQFTEGLKMSEAARQKIEAARDAHDDLRFNLESMSSKEIQAAKRAEEEGKIASTNEAITALMRENDLNRADATALYGARVNQILAANNREYQAFEAAEGRKFTGSQTEKQMAQTERLSNRQIAASAGQAAAGRDLQRELARAPGQTEQFVARLANSPTLQKGYEMYTADRNAGRADKATLDMAREIVASAITPSQKLSPDYIAAQKIIQNALGSSRFNTTSLPPNDPNLISRSQ
jgi:hypothetical protein